MTTLEILKTAWITAKVLLVIIALFLHDLPSDYVRGRGKMRR